MIKYIVQLNEPKITLDIMGRKQTFINNKEVLEDIYTKTYPQYFKRLGEITGFSNYLSKPVFIPDSITEFVQKESTRVKETKKIITPNDQKVKEVKIDEIAEAIDEFVEEKTGVDLDKNDIIDIIESFSEEDVKIETEE